MIEQTKLRAAVDELLLMFENRVSCAMVARKGRFIYWGPDCLDFWGYDALEAVGMSVEALIPKAQRREHVNQRNRFTSSRLNSRSMAGGLAVEGVQKDGDKKKVVISLIKVKALAPWSPPDVVILCSNEPLSEALQQSIATAQQQVDLKSMVKRSRAYVVSLLTAITAAINTVPPEFWASLPVLSNFLPNSSPNQEEQSEIQSPSKTFDDASRKTRRNVRPQSDPQRSGDEAGR